MSAQDQSDSHGPYAKLTGVQATPQPNGKGSEWVQITYTLNGVSVSSKKVSVWTVLRPGGLGFVSLIDLSWNQAAASYPNAGIQPGHTGYASIYVYQLQDQFDQSMASIDINEQFNAWTADYSGENWPVVTPNASQTDGDGNISDVFGCGLPSPPYIPAPTVPQSPLGTTQVQHAAHIYRAGSQTQGQGYLVGYYSTQFYLDHGRNQ